MLTRLRAIAELRLSENVPLSQYTRFGIGGPADLLVDAPSEDAFAAAWAALRSEGVPVAVIGGGSNLVVSDAGFRGAVLRFTGDRISIAGDRVTADAGAVLQRLVDTANAAGLRGLETMTGIPGWVGGAVYGNAGAYGRSMHEIVESVRFFDGERILDLPNAGCEFQYRESVFKRRKCWVIFSAAFRLAAAPAAELQRTSDDIRAVRDAKYPPSMKCAGSIFKNCFFTALPEAARAAVPPALVREGKVPSAFFLEQTGAKGLRRGDIQVAAYHANLIYNDGAGAAADLRAVIAELKSRVAAKFGFELEEEVQYVGF